MTGHLEILKLMVKTAKKHDEEQASGNWRSWLFSMEKHEKLGKFLHKIKNEGKQL